MNTTHEALHEVRRIMVRDDVELSLPSTMLIRMVYNAIDHHTWTPFQNPDADHTPETVLRSLLTFCYTTGIFSSSDIEAAATHDPVVRYLCANHRPQWETIREFRRRSMCGLRISIGNVLGLAARCFVDGKVPLPQFLSGADQLLGRAIQADSNALDI